MKKLTSAQQRVIHYAKLGGQISSHLKGAQIEYQKIPYKFNMRTLNSLLSIGVIEKSGSIGMNQLYKFNPDALINKLNK